MYSLSVKKIHIPLFYVLASNSTHMENSFFFLFPRGAAVLLLPLTSAHAYLLKMLLCILAHAPLIFQTSSLSGYLLLQMPLPGFTAGAIYFYFSYTNRPDALLHQEGYASITGGCQCCVSVGICLVKLLTETSCGLAQTIRPL